MSFDIIVSHWIIASISSSQLHLSLSKYLRDMFVYLTLHRFHLLLHFILKGSLQDSFVLKFSRLLHFRTRATLSKTFFCRPKIREINKRLLEVWRNNCEFWIKKSSVVYIVRFSFSPTPFKNCIPLPIRSAKEVSRNDSAAKELKSAAKLQSAA